MPTMVSLPGSLFRLSVLLVLLPLIHTYIYAQGQSEGEAITPEVSGRICFLNAPQECMPTAGDLFVVEKRSDLSGAFVWENANGSELLFGYLGAEAQRTGERAISLSDYQRLGFTLESTDPRQWPTDVNLALRTDEKRWTWELAQAKAPKLRAILLQTGDYEISMDAPMHATLHRGFHLDKDDATWGKLYLKRLSLISGRVVDKKTTLAIPGALVLQGETVLGQTDVAGRYEIPVTGEWPELIRFSAIGYGDSVRALPKRVADHVLDTIAMGKEAGLNLHISAPGPATVRLEQVLDNKTLEVAKAEIPEAGQTELSFEGLADVEHRIVIEGRNPFERFVRTTTPIAGETTLLYLDITTFDLKVKIEQGGRPASVEKLVLMHEGDLWQSSDDLRGKSTYETHLWQDGTFQTIIRLEGSVSTLSEKRETRGTKTEWIFNVPDNDIDLTILERGSRRPVADALLILRSSFAGGETLVRNRASATGGASFRGLREGVHELSIVAEGYMDAAARYVLAANGGRRQEEIFLDAAALREVLVVAPTGAPQPGTLVMHAGSTEPALTGPDGRVQVQVPTQGQRTYWFLPPQGSFTYATIGGGNQSHVTVVVPFPTAALTVNARAESGEPLQNVGLLLRYDGVMMPLNVLDLLKRFRQYNLDTNHDGVILIHALPPGLYEMWPVFTYRQLAGLVASPPAAAAATIAVQPGQNTVTMNFRKSAP